MEAIKETPKVYSVWVDGAEINDYYLTEQEATELKNHYIKDGYSNATIRKEREEN